MEMAVLAGVIDVEVVVGVLDRARAPPAGDEFPEQGDDEGGLAGVLVAGDAEKPRRRPGSR